jgi:hypothetical protein
MHLWGVATMLRDTVPLLVVFAFTAIVFVSVHFHNRRIRAREHSILAAQEADSERHFQLQARMAEAMERIATAMERHNRIGSKMLPGTSR